MLQVPALKLAGFRVVAPDLCGFGNSSKPDDEAAYALQHVQGDVEALLDALNIVRCVPIANCSIMLLQFVSFAEYALQQILTVRAFQKTCASEHRALHMFQLVVGICRSFSSSHTPQVFTGGPRLGRSAGVAHGSHPAKARGAPCCHLCRPPRSSPRTTSHILSGCSLPEKT